MKALAHGYVYWPNIDKKLEELVKSCTKYQLNAKSPRKTKLYSWPIPESPCSRLLTDFPGPINVQHYLILVDAYSIWPEVFHMNHPTSSETVKKPTGDVQQIWYS